jgi:tetratricopeptide (TPR) repeat protein
MLRALALLACGALAACATPRENLPAGLAPEATTGAVPFFAQEEKYCGPASLAMVLAWSGLDVAPADTAPLLFTPERGGTFQHELLAGARRYGRLAIELDQPADLLAEVAAGNPVLVLQNLGLGWYPVWHYAVVTGYDLPAGELVLHSGRDRNRVMSFETFERTWARAGQWGLVVLPPARLPASGRERQLLEAAAGLERADRPGAAATAYSAILGRWPLSQGALIGLGNASYAMGDLEVAERALRRATLLHPEGAAAWNNLAHVLAERGSDRQAMAAARTAVALGGPHLAQSRATLREIVAPADG